MLIHCKKSESCNTKTALSKQSDYQIFWQQTISCKKLIFKISQILGENLLLPKKLDFKIITDVGRKSLIAPNFFFIDLHGFGEKIYCKTENCRGKALKNLKMKEIFKTSIFVYVFGHLCGETAHEGISVLYLKIIEFGLRILRHSDKQPIFGGCKQCHVSAKVVM